jgi:hypothetical protein
MKACATALAIAVILVSANSCARVETRGADSVTVRRVPRDGLQPQVAVDQTGTLHLLFFAGEPRAGNLFYARSNDQGVTFTPPIQVNSQSGSAIATGTIRGGQIAIGRDGRVHVAWNGSDDAAPRGPADPRTGRPGAPFLYARSSGATRFEAQENLMQQSLALDGGGSIAADRSGNVYAAWHGRGIDDPEGETHRRVWIARSSDSGATFSAEAPAWSQATGTCGCCGMELLTNAEDQLFALYRSASTMTNRDIYLLASNDRGRSFTGSLLHRWNIGACPMTSMSLAAQGARVFAAWETDGQVYFGEVSPGTASLSRVVPAPGSPGGRKHPRLAIGRNGDVLLVWTEGTAWARGGSLAWQSFDASGEPTGLHGSATGVPAWSFAAPVARPDGGFTIFY